MLRSLHHFLSRYFPVFINSMLQGLKNYSLQGIQDKKKKLLIDVRFFKVRTKTKSIHQCGTLWEFLRLWFMIQKMTLPFWIKSLPAKQLHFVKKNMFEHKKPPFAISKVSSSEYTFLSHCYRQRLTEAGFLKWRFNNLLNISLSYCGFFSYWTQHQTFIFWVLQNVSTTLSIMYQKKIFFKIISIKT